MLYLGTPVYGIYTSCRENDCCSLTLWAILMISTTIIVMASSVVNIIYQVVT